ncbi:MAG TPA: PSD1 and planctomycete cytochrome C domain-containing protein [Tepidisphaeraceae bacterium]|jgi:hypothetical protein|nr:PSD1 and planctomycete cytochrome C domain-containing protein [Tepidisphaeraceae bacterium]
MLQRWMLGLSVLAMLGEAGVGAARAETPPPARAVIDFNHEIRPILSNSCFTCHGPDSHARKAKLRLDLVGDDAHAMHDNGIPFVAGDLAKSEAIRRITSTDPDEKMPPPKSGKRLSARQIELLKKWVLAGAKYEKHWAFIPPKRSALPEVKDAAWCRNPIDRFILARLEAEGLKPSKEADKVTLCRRLHLDLLGLPPTPKEVDDFVADNSPDAYEKLVDSLLANPHYGERMALDWLDAARFADTHGYHIDAGRDQSRWRDWVIDAFNKDEPFDQFTVEQLAGDLLPNSTDDQKIATGFVRNNMINFEGGAIPQEYLTAYLMDRVNTTSMVWLGLTLQCCECHDHKFDPFTQKNYYQMYAFFNAVPERGLDGQKGNAEPVLATPTRAEKQLLAAIAASMKAVEGQLTGPKPDLDAEQAAWEKTAAVQAHTDWIVLDPTSMKSAGGAMLKIGEDQSIRADGPNPTDDVYTIAAPAGIKVVTAIRLEALPDDKLNGKGPGRSINGNMVLTNVELTAGTGTGAAAKAAKFKAASADFSQEKYPVANAIDDDPQTGWAIFPEVGKPHAAVFELAEPVHNDGKVNLTITLAFKSGFGGHQLGHFRLSVTNSTSPHGVDLTPANIRHIVAIAPETRTEAQRAELRSWFRENVATSTRNLRQRLAALTKEKEAVIRNEPNTMVMAEMAKPRDTFILSRGQYDKPGEKVTADVPESLMPLQAGLPHNRLGLARWIVSPEQPLTSRVIVNRYWQSLFGIGIVKTVADFGSQGEEPTHPQLLDWLAVQFMEGDESPTTVAGAGAKPWDVKAMLKLMVMSSTYRQSSVATPEQVAADPENRMLARGARFRLPAEFIRDEALAASGLLSDEIGGRSVEPYQPAGLWEELMSRGDGAKWTAQVYKQDHGKDLYKRTMYTFWKRSSPPASLSTFDAPDRETCTVQRSRTNTPLQALVLMNDPTYVEASRKLAERAMTEAASGDDAKINMMFRLIVARAPTAAEVAVLKRVFVRQHELYQKNPQAAAKFLAVGESPRNEKLDQAELAAWATVASVMLNLDEAITKG